MSSLFLPEPSAWDCPPLTDEMVLEAQRRLGVLLPKSYLDILRQRNGGMLRRSDYPLYLDFMRGHVSAPVLFGIGGDRGIDSDYEGRYLSTYLADEWDYPHGSIVISHFGQCGLALDYRGGGNSCEPTVVFNYGGTLPNTLVPVTDSFAQFVSALILPPFRNEPQDAGS